MNDHSPTSLSGANDPMAWRNDFCASSARVSVLSGSVCGHRPGAVHQDQQSRAAPHRGPGRGQCAHRLDRRQPVAGLGVGHHALPLAVRTGQHAVRRPQPRSGHQVLGRGVEQRRPDDLGGAADHRRAVGVLVGHRRQREVEAAADLGVVDRHDPVGVGRVAVRRDHVLLARRDRVDLAGGDQLGRGLVTREAGRRAGWSPPAAARVEEPVNAQRLSSPAASTSMSVVASARRPSASASRLFQEGCRAGQPRCLAAQHGQHDRAGRHRLRLAPEPLRADLARARLPQPHRGVGEPQVRQRRGQSDALGPGDLRGCRGGRLADDVQREAVVGAEPGAEVGGGLFDDRRDPRIGAERDPWWGRSRRRPRPGPPLRPAARRTPAVTTRARHSSPSRSSRPRHGCRGFPRWCVPP